MRAILRLRGRHLLKRRKLPIQQTRSITSMVIVIYHFIQQLNHHHRDTTTHARVPRGFMMTSPTDILVSPAENPVSVSGFIVINVFPL
ncbi:hypothetical protein J6590_065851 [Homalodisca vitripennis]|nr:hypothetical protein J6590_065851 [Homalodisca vitripennis]